MTYKGYTIKRHTRETQFGKYSIFLICDNENIVRETSVSAEVAQHVIDTKVSLGHWPDLEVKNLAD